MPYLRRRVRERLSVVVALLGLLVIAVAPTSASATPPSFGTEGSGPGQVIEPRGLAVAQEGGDVYIADRNNNRIDKFGPEGEFMLAWGFGVADGTSEVLQKCTTSCFGGVGSPFEGAGTGQLSSAEGIAVNNDALSEQHNDIYVGDAANNRIQIFDPKGKFVAMFGGEVNKTRSEEGGSTEAERNLCTAASGNVCQKGASSSAPGAFKVLNGRSIAIDTTGTVYVGDENRVQRFSSAGVLQGETALPGVGFIENLAVDSSEDIYVAGEARVGVHEYDEAGAEVTPPRDEEGEARNLALAIGPSDELFVNDFRAGVHHLLAFDAAGNEVASFDGGSEAQDGESGIAYSNTLKALYVLTSGSVRIVSPPPPGPLVLSESVGAILPTSATFGAVLNPEGPEATKYHFEYGTSTAYGQSTAEEPLTGGAFEDQSVSAPVASLQPRTVYHFRVVVTNGTLTTDGPDQTFTTLPPVSIDSTSVTQVSATSARLETELNPHGLQSEYHFEYGTSTAYGTSVPIPDGSAGAGSSDVTRRELLQGLLPSTTYHYRVIAHNSLGTVEGPDRSFTTQGSAAFLPDGRQWEMVSPPNKHGAPLEPITEEGGMVQAAVNGGAFAYVAIGPADERPAGNRSPEDVQLLAQRNSTGWSTQNITTAHEVLAIPQVGSPSEYRLFSEDLSAAIVEHSAPRRSRRKRQNAPPTAVKQTANSYRW